MLKKKGGGFLGHARRAASAVSVLALFSSMTGAAYADGKYVAAMSTPSGQAPQCSNPPKSAEIDVSQGSVTAKNDRGKCVGPLKSDGTFSCSFHARANSTTTFSGKISGPNVNGSYDTSVTPPPIAGPGFSCHSTFKGSAS